MPGERVSCEVGEAALGSPLRAPLWPSVRPLCWASLAQAQVPAVLCLRLLSQRRVVAREVTSTVSACSWKKAPFLVGSLATSVYTFRHPAMSFYKYLLINTIFQASVRKRKVLGFLRLDGVADCGTYVNISCSVLRISMKFLLII